MIDLTGKIALVTGAGRGIGKGCALELARQGAHIVLNDRPDSPDLIETAGEIRALGVDCHPVSADVFERDNCEKLVKAAIQAAGPLDILVSNPAFSRRGDYADYDPGLFDKTIQGTLSSGFHLSQFVSRHMIDRGVGGKMVFISSIHSFKPLARAAAYNAGKAGLNHLMRSIAVELIRYRINVNAVAPGWIDTPGEHETFSGETMAEVGKQMPWGRLGLPEDIGKAAAFLCSDAADYITGVVLPVDGGLMFQDCLPGGQPPPKHME